MNQDEGAGDVDDVLADLFAAERRRSGPPLGTQERVRSAVFATIAAGAVVGSGAAAASTTAATAVSSASGAGASSGAASVASISALSGAAAIIKPAGFVVAAVVATAGGSVFVANYEPTPLEPVSTAVVVEDAPRPVAPQGLVIAAEKPAPKKPAKPTIDKPREVVVDVVAAVVPPTPVVVETPAERTARLAGERAFIAEARASPSRDDTGGALVALEAHRGTHPDGALAEEREALTVLALARAGRVDEAKARATKFTARWPKSIFAPALAAALQN